MASSRLEKIGNIFTRVNGLLRSGALKPEDRPIFFDIYKAFPPLKEPRYGQEADPNIKIRPIFYPEDVDRAADETNSALYNLNETKTFTKEQISYQKELKQTLSSTPKDKQQKIFDFQKEIEDLKV